MRWPLIFTGLGLLLAFAIGWKMLGSFAGGVQFFLIASVLAILEISLSFDNAIVNAAKLKTMTPLWQKRFLTWGILIAVFGMRILFPLMVVSVAAHVSPLMALEIAILDPARYSALIHDAHLPIAAFGGTFLMMVALSYFMDTEKDIHWISPVEKCFCSCAGVRGFQIGAVALAVVIFAFAIGGHEAIRFLKAAGLGLVTYVAVEQLGNVLDRKAASGAVAKGAFGAFLYLEVLDASFSFDGVIGAFALTQNLFLIAIGLGIGALYVRSMTIMLVERETLAEFRYLEHGAFYSILVLSFIMFAQVLMPVPEVITGTLGAGFILLSLFASMRYRKRKALE
ncbi:MAG: DUF475 domain-containing protein [Rhodobacteraceae bacterium]|nr:DUF475 domain-containing protein [Paracoccaceae bacterium]